MDQKLQDLLLSVPPRAAWIMLGGGVGFWLLCLTGALTPPLTAPATITLFWFYAVLMLMLASGVAAIAAAAALVVRRRGRDRGEKPDTEPPDAEIPPETQEGDGSAEDLNDPEELADLRRLLDNPGREDR